ncbi:hypothetical protein QBC46DRAFT_365732 [Diplogelasinospora grovesii]|uniref:BTB domain-containing protein n=1 Tax=Diplogelasinospora grovesii TaxID=303347 RepID=A0AAN6S2H7_9PEZI|nr:hypothetical protein QBC46DRAFT_365732 [Diplogelasinospora grovesii]
MSNGKVTILVREDENTFHLDGKELYGCSQFFASALTGGFREAEESIVRLPEIDAQTFRIFERWLSGQRISGFKDLDWRLLCKFFVLTDYLQVSSVQEPLLSVLRLKRRESGSVPISQIPFIYDNTLSDSPLRRLWVGWVMELPAPEIFEDEKWEFPKEFLPHIIRKMKAAQQMAGMSALMHAGVSDEDVTSPRDAHRRLPG